MLVTASPTGLRVLGGSKGQASHSFSRCSGEKEKPSIHRNVCGGNPSLWRLWTGQRQAQGKESGLLLSLPELFRAQFLLTQDSKAVWANSRESHEQTQERTTSGHSSAHCHHPQGQSLVSAMPTELGHSVLLTGATRTEEQCLWPQRSDPTNNTKESFPGGSAQPSLFPQNGKVTFKLLISALS